MPRIITPQDEEVERTRRAYMVAKAEQLSAALDHVERCRKALADYNAARDAQAQRLSEDIDAFVHSFCQA